MLPRKEEAMGSVNAEWGPRSELMFDRGNLCQENGGTGITCVVSIWCSQVGFSPSALYLNACTWEIKKKQVSQQFCKENGILRLWCPTGWKLLRTQGNLIPGRVHSQYVMVRCMREFIQIPTYHLTRERLVPSITLSPSRSWPPFCSSLHLSEWIAVFPFLGIYFPRCFFLKE